MRLTTLSCPHLNRLLTQYPDVHIFFLTPESGLEGVAENQFDSTLSFAKEISRWSIMNRSRWACK